MTNSSNCGYLAVARRRDEALLAVCYPQHLDSHVRACVDCGFRDSLQQQTNLVRQKRTVDNTEYTLYMLSDQDNRFVYATAAGKDLTERLAWQLLEEFASRVVQTHGDLLAEAQPESLTRPLKKSMREMMTKYETPAAIDKTAEVQAKVDGVSGIMQDNVKRILETHAHLESLEEKTSTMQSSANQFLKQSVDLRRQMQMRNLKVKIILGAVCLAIIMYIASLFFA